MDNVIITIIITYIMCILYPVQAHSIHGRFLGSSEHHGTTGLCSERYHYFAHDLTLTFVPEMKMAIIRVPSCQVSPGYDPLQILHQTLITQHLLRRGRICTALNVTRHLHLRRDNKASRSTLSTNSYC